MSSSHRAVPTEEATLQRNDIAVGPMRLPSKEPSRFIEEFNRLYRSAGLIIHAKDDVTDDELAADGKDSQEHAEHDQ